MYSISETAKDRDVVTTDYQYEVAPFPMTLSDFKVIHLLHTFQIPHTAFGKVLTDI